MGLIDLITRDNDPRETEGRKEYLEAMQRKRWINAYHSIGNAIFSLVIVFLALPHIPWIICSVILWVSISWTLYRTWKFWPTRNANQW